MGKWFMSIITKITRTSRREYIYFRSREKNSYSYYMGSNSNSYKTDIPFIF
jgi:hypothetical protein